MTEQALRELRLTLRVLERELERALRVQTECCGVSLAQCHLLLALEEAGSASIGELATALDLDQSTLSRTVDGLVKSGLAERREDPDNRRRQIVSLSGTGKAKADTINELCDDYYRSLFATLQPGEAGTLLTALPILARALKSFRPGDSAPVCCKLPRRSS